MRYLPILMRLAPSLLAVVVYLPTVGYELVFDDRSLIGEDGPVWLGNATLPYRPLRYLSLLLDHRLGGGQVAVYHATNVVLHALACALLGGIARALGLRTLAACLAALLFAVHPLAVEVVAYVAGRRDLLATVCGLAAIALWTGPRSRSAPALLLVLLGVAAKESALLYVPALAAASFFGLGSPPRLSWQPLVWTGLAAIALPVAYGAIGPLLPAGSPVAAVVVAGRLAWHYGAALLVPARLSVDYPHLHCRADCLELWGVRAAAGLVALAAVALPSIFLCGRRVAVFAERASVPAPGAFVLAWVALFALPLAGAIGAHEPGADRHAYPLLAAIAVLVAAGAQGLVDRCGTRPGRRWVRRATGVAAVAAVVALTAATVARIPVWKNERTLWTATVRTAPQSARARHNLAAALAADGAYRRSRRQLLRALAVDDSYGPAHLALAWLACVEQRYGAASARLARARALGIAESRLREVAGSCRQPRPSR